jgi:hypothetical protein
MSEMSNSSISGESVPSSPETVNNDFKLLLSPIEYKGYKYFKSESRMSGGLSVGDYKCCHSKKQGCRARMIIRVEDNKNTQNVVSNNKALNDDITMIENNSKILRVILNKVEHSCQLVTKQRSICELDVVLPIEVNSIVDIRS